MAKEEPTVVYRYRGSSREIPWAEIRRTIAAQFARDGVLALTVTCSSSAALPAADDDARAVGPVTTGAKRATVADVAREAQVSPSTVSRVLNDYWSIGAETQKRVEAAMRRLGYKPNEAARSMVQSKVGRNGKHDDGVLAEHAIAPLD